LRIDIGARTDVGCVREGNEDNYRVVSDLNLFILSDGIGGEAHGEVASEIAVNAVEEHCHEGARDPSLPLEGEQRADLSERTNRLASAVRRANRLIREAAVADDAMGGMGATIVTTWLDGDKLSLVHVGDSRAYRLRAGVLEQLTRDHSLVSEQVRLGILTPEQAERSEYQTMLIRALGAAENVEVDVAEHVLLPGDCLMLCSDGLSRMLRDDVIARTILNSGKAQNTVDALVELAREVGGHDNITVILIRSEAHTPSLLERISFWWNRKPTA
jgi:PPM family protein phosphatase